MVEYTEEQKLVSKALLKGEKTLKELEEELKISSKKIDEALAGLMKLRLVQKKEEKYRLIDYVVKKLSPKKIAENFKIKMIIEGSSNDEESLKKQMDVLEKKLLAENCKILKFEKSETVKIGENYSMFFDCEIATTEFKDIIYLIINYGPSFVEILEPKKIELSLSQTQEILNNIVSAVHYYAGLVIQTITKPKQRQ